MSFVASSLFLLLLFCVLFCLLFFVYYFSGWCGKPVSSLPVNYFVCLNNFFVICFFFVISSSSFLCFVLFVVFCLLFFRLVWKTSFLSSRRITVNLPALTHRYLPTLLSSKAPVKKQYFFSSAHKQHFTESLVGVPLIILLLFCSALLLIETDLRETLKDLE